MPMKPSEANEEPPGDVSSQNAEEPSTPQGDDSGGLSESGASKDKRKSQGQEGSSTEGSQATGHPDSAG